MHINSILIWRVLFLIFFFMLQQEWRQTFGSNNNQLNNLFFYYTLISPRYWPCKTRNWTIARSILTSVKLQVCRIERTWFIAHLIAAVWTIHFRPPQISVHSESPGDRYALPHAQSHSRTRRDVSILWERRFHRVRRRRFRLPFPPGRPAMELIATTVS